MAKEKLAKFEAGKTLSAKALNAMAEEIDKLANMTSDPPIDIIKTPGSIAIRLSSKRDIFAKITSGTNPYAWTEVVPAAGGTFVNAGSGNSGTTSSDPAYEQTGNTSVPGNTIVRMSRAIITNEWIFQFAKC